jgi:hypothetical protein
MPLHILTAERKVVIKKVFLNVWKGLKFFDTLTHTAACRATGYKTIKSYCQPQGKWSKKVFTNMWYG